ncbi:MAG: hypothetical protein IKD72_05340 [Clostridia bacterium]|nr:hypothetical protein [Clostridia bacterium]
MYTNTCATVYAKQNGGYRRIFLPAVFWDAVQQSNTVRSGATVTDSAALFIPFDGQRLTLQAGDLVLPGNVGFAFDSTSEQTISESLKTLRALHGPVYAVTAFDAKLFGSRSMWHYEVSLK